MNRLPFTKQDVLDAYAYLKPMEIKPTSGKFLMYKDDGDTICGMCAISAVTAHREKYKAGDHFPAGEYAKRLFIDDKLLWAFIDGFDRPSSTEYVGSLLEDIFKFGKELREELFPCS